ELARQSLKRPGFACVDQLAVGGQGGVGIVAGFEQAVTMAFGLAALRLQQIVAHVGPGYVYIAPDAFQESRAGEEVFADRIVRAADLIERLNAVEPGEAHEDQQASEACQQHQAARDWSGFAHIGGNSILASGRLPSFSDLELICISHEEIES